MANIEVRDGDSSEKHLKATGAGTSGDPFVPHHNVDTVEIPTTIYSGQKTITTPGTEEALASSQVLLSGVNVKALAGNAGVVYVGPNPVTSSTGYELSAGESVFIEVANLATVFVDVASGGEGVSYLGS